MTHAAELCPGTRALRNPERFSPWSRWVNLMGQTGELCSRCRRLTYIDTDGWWLQERARKHVLLFGLEVKSHGETFTSPGQCMTLNTLEAALSRSDGSDLLIEDMWGKPGWNGRRTLHFLGFHTLGMDGDVPSSSDSFAASGVTVSSSLVWDGVHEVSPDELVAMMSFRHDPRMPGKPLILGEAA